MVNLFQSIDVCTVFFNSQIWYWFYHLESETCSLFLDGWIGNSVHAYLMWREKWWNIYYYEKKPCRNRNLRAIWKRQYCLFPVENVESDSIALMHGPPTVPRGEPVENVESDSIACSPDGGAAGHAWWKAQLLISFLGLCLDWVRNQYLIL